MFNSSKDSSYSFFKDDEEQPQSAYDEADAPRAKKRNDDDGLGFSSSNFLGMTAVQRFVISVLFLMMVCILGAMFLLVTGSFYLPL